MGKRKVNNALKAKARVKSLKKQAANRIKRALKGPSAGQKLADIMHGRTKT